VTYKNDFAMKRLREIL